MTAIPSGILLLFFGTVSCQLAAVWMLPKTAGFTHLGFTLACSAVFILSFGLIARMIHSGVNLSALAPLISAVVPLGAVLIGVFVYGEKASMLKVILLIGACGLIALASARD